MQSEAEKKPRLRDWLLIIGVMLMVVGLLFYPLFARSEDHGYHGVGHERLHHWYRKLMRPDMPKSSCCSDEDCRPTQARQLADKSWEALVDGEWVKIPPEKVNREESFDSQAHICAPKYIGYEASYPKGYIFCFVKPGAGT